MHKPVMVREVLEYLNPPVGGVVVDATVGAGGHARARLPARLNRPAGDRANAIAGG